MNGEGVFFVELVARGWWDNGEGGALRFLRRIGGIM